MNEVAMPIIVNMSSFSLFANRSLLAEGLVEVVEAGVVVSVEGPGSINLEEVVVDVSVVVSVVGPGTIGIVASEAGVVDGLEGVCVLVEVEGPGTAVLVVVEDKSVVEVVL